METIWGMAFGPPGTGKTTYLRQVALECARRYGADQLLIASFTRTGAREIASRVPEIPRHHVATLHALAYRALGRPPLALSKEGLASWNASSPSHWHLGSTIDLDDEVPHQGNAIVDQARSGGRSGETTLEEVERMRARMIPEHRWSRTARDFWARWQSWKAEGGWMDFSDLIETAAVSAYVPFGARVLLVDEAQDLTALELALVRAWGQSCQYVVLAGDDDQCIFRFRGAEPEAFLSMRGRDEHLRHLSQSYRVPRAVYDYAVRWTGSIEGMRQPKQYHPRDEDGLVEMRETDYGAQGARQLVQSLDLSRTSMILASCSYMLAEVIAELRAAGIPFHNPYRASNGAWNPLRGQEDRITSWLADRGSWTWGQAWRSLEIVSAVKTGWTRGWKERVKRLATDERTRELPVTVDLWSMLTGVHRIPAGVAWLLDHMSEAPRKSLSYPISVLDKHGPGALAERPKVIVGTIHSVKGGEADDVHLALDISRATANDSKMANGRDSVRRMVYVGATRARHRLYVYAARERHLSARL